MTIVHEYYKICNKVKQVNAEIRFARVINSRGGLVVGGIKEGIPSLSS